MRHIVVSTLARRHEVRVRALLYTEYIIFSKLLLSGGNIAGLTEETWKDEVRLVELHIINNEYPHLLTVPLETNFEPLGIFFDLTLNHQE